MIYAIVNEDGFFCHYCDETFKAKNGFTKIQLSQEDYSFLESLIIKKRIGNQWVEGAINEQIQEQTLSKIAISEKYPELSGMNFRLLQLDNLPDIQRLEPISDKGLKGVKKYVKDGVLIWSIETKFWFENDSNFPEGVVKTVKLYDIGKRVVDSWTKKVNLSSDDKEVIRKEQRERILSYFKSQQSDLYNFLYSFFKSEIDDYVQTGDKAKFESVLVWAKDNHPYQDENENYIVRLTLSQEIPTQSEGTTTVLNGILDELV
jgi:hypothetical protein